MENPLEMAAGEKSAGMQIVRRIQSMINRFLFLGLLLCVAVGCDRDRNRVDFDPCNAGGMVTIDGKPLASGMVTFNPTIPESAGGHPGIASIDAAGRYQLGNAEHGRAKLLRPGEYVVTVVAMEIDRSKGPPAPRLAIPERYADFAESPLHITLSPGDNTVDLNLIR
jgi:hypothetical protein